MQWVNPELLRRMQDVDGGAGYEQELIVQVRSRHQGVRARMHVIDTQRCQISWCEDWAAVSPGQAAVMYDLNNEELLAGGRIAKESAAP